jgi:pimeloyl-ACP methyl ester carboxylesterase
VFARELVKAGSEDANLPYLLFLQGGPGGASPRPASASEGWIGVALDSYRVLLLDQRGCGLSTPITRRTAQGRTPQELAAYLRHFRADSIVADCELLRTHIIGDRQWDTLGQSYGGFVTLSYLSTAPEGLRQCFITGGLPGLDATADDVYARTFDRMERRTREFYERYPQDRDTLRALATYVQNNDVRLPDGDRLSVNRLRTLGIPMGMSDGFERVHWILDRAWDGDGLSDTFAYDVMGITGFIDNAQWALQESCYAQGSPTRWAAQRAMDLLAQFREDADPLLLTAEMMFPWMFQEISSLKPFAEAAEINAQFDSWPPLYDTDRLARNEVPVTAAVYLDDVYVDSGLQIETAAQVPNVRTWVTNEFEHDGVRSGPAVFRRLLDMAAGRQ